MHITLEHTQLLLHNVMLHNYICTHHCAEPMRLFRNELLGQAHEFLSHPLPTTADVEKVQLFVTREQDTWSACFPPDVTSAVQSMTKEQVCASASLIDAHLATCFASHRPLENLFVVTAAESLQLLELRRSRKRSSLRLPVTCAPDCTIVVPCFCATLGGHWTLLVANISGVSTRYHLECHVLDSMAHATDADLPDVVEVAKALRKQLLASDGGQGMTWNLNLSLLRASQQGSAHDGGFYVMMWLRQLADAIKNPVLRVWPAQLRPAHESFMHLYRLLLQLEILVGHSLTPHFQVQMEGSKCRWNPPFMFVAALPAQKQTSASNVGHPPTALLSAAVLQQPDPPANHNAQQGASAQTAMDVDGDDATASVSSVAVPLQPVFEAISPSSSPSPVNVVDETPEPPAPEDTSGVPEVTTAIGCSDDAASASSSQNSGLEDSDPADMSASLLRLKATLTASDSQRADDQQRLLAMIDNVKTPHDFALVVDAVREEAQTRHREQCTYV